MPNIELLEKSTPTAPIRIVALAGCQDLAKEVDKKRTCSKEKAKYDSTGLQPSFFPG